MTSHPASTHIAIRIRARLAALVVGLTVLCAGCVSTRPQTPPAGSAPTVGEDASSQSAQQIIVEWIQNRNVAEWILARLAGACWDVSQKKASAEARFEILELRANYASSCMSMMNGITPRSQIVGMAILTEMVHRVWVVEGRAATLLGAEAAPLEAALGEIRKGMLTECLRYFSQEEVDRIMKGVESWRAAHPGRMDVTFLRFDTTTDEVAKTLGNVGDDPGGLFGSLDGRLYNALLLGERMIFQLSRMPRLVEWHTEAALAAALSQQEVQAAVHSLKSFERLEPVLTSESDRFQSTLNAMPERLTEALVHQPEIVGLLKTSRELEVRLGALENTVETFDKTVSQLSERLGSLTAAAEPGSVSTTAAEAMTAMLQPLRSMVLLLLGGAAGLILLHAALRRWRP